jgi:hypothetical protein
MIDNIMAVIALALLLGLSFMSGQAVTEKKYCVLKGGVYSFDFMECMKYETVK